MSAFSESKREGRKEGRKCFYLTTHSTHFILRLYDVGHMLKDHSDNEREETRRRHMGYSFHLTARVLFYMHDPRDRISHTTAFVIQVVEHWLELEVGQWVHPMKDRSDNQSHHERTLLPRSPCVLTTDDSGHLG